MTKILPITTENIMEKFFANKPIVKNSKRVPVDTPEMRRMNEELEKARLDFRSKSAASLMAVHDFFYNA